MSWTASMHDDYLLKYLLDFGLSANEAKIYLAMLVLGNSTATAISELSEVNRSTCYVVLESLRKKDLVKIADNFSVRKYVASSPEILLYYAKALAKKQEFIRTGIESILPVLKALRQKNVNLL